LENLFPLNGKIPSPAWVPKKALYPGSLFAAYSRRIRREVFFVYSVEFLFFLMVEFHPEVLWFVEHYPKIFLNIYNKKVTTTFDMLIRHKSKDFLLFEVKSKGFKDFDSPQIQRQRFFSETFSIPYKIIIEDMIDKNTILISNLKKLIGYVAWDVKPNLKSQILNFIYSSKQAEIRQVTEHFHQITENELYTGIVHLIHDGDIKAPLHKYEFNKSMVLSVEGEGHESEFPF